MKRLSASILLLSSLSWTHVGQAANTGYVCQADCYVNIKLKSGGGGNPLARVIRERMEHLSWPYFTGVMAQDEGIYVAWNSLVQQCEQAADCILDQKYGKEEYYIENSRLVHGTDEQHFSRATVMNSCTR